MVFRPRKNQLTSSRNLQFHVTAMIKTGGCNTKAVVSMFFFTLSKCESFKCESLSSFIADTVFLCVTNTRTLKASYKLCNLCQSFSLSTTLSALLCIQYMD